MGVRRRGGEREVAGRRSRAASAAEAVRTCSAMGLGALRAALEQVQGALGAHTSTLAGARAWTCTEEARGVEVVLEVARRQRGVLLRRLLRACAVVAV